MVTLTKGFYMAEHPITEEMYEAVVGGNPSREKAAKAPVNVSCVNMYEFCRLLSEKTGRKVRVPTAAEWEYAARVGTSNPALREKYQDQDSGSVRPMAVKSKRPNAWGFYDMLSSGWERVSDGSGQLDRQDAMDPRHIPPEDKGEADKSRQHGHFGRGNSGYAPSEIEYITSDPGPEKTYPGVVRFRVVVEASPAPLTGSATSGSIEERTVEKGTERDGDVVSKISWMVLSEEEHKRLGLPLIRNGLGAHREP